MSAKDQVATITGARKFLVETVPNEMVKYGHSLVQEIKVTILLKNGEILEFNQKWQ